MSQIDWFLCECRKHMKRHSWGQLYWRQKSLGQLGCSDLLIETRVQKLFGSTTEKILSGLDQEGFLIDLSLVFVFRLFHRKCFASWSSSLLQWSLISRKETQRRERPRSTLKRSGGTTDVQRSHILRNCYVSSVFIDIYRSSIHSCKHPNCYDYIPINGWYSFENI